MNFKEKLQQKIEQNAIKSNLTWTDKKGYKHQEEVLLKRSRAVLGDWNRIYPPIDEEGNIKWINLIFGGYKNLIKLIAITAIVGMVLYQFKANFEYIQYLKNIPCVQSCLQNIII